MDQLAVDIEQAGAVIGFVHQMVVPDLVVQRGRFGHERQLQKYSRGERLSAVTRELKVKSAQNQAARASADVAVVAKRPKNRPGRRERSSITMGAARRQAKLV